MATIRDVARLANVSVTTVSRVMNGDQTVHPALRRVVEQVARDLDYRPNPIARQLRTRRSGVVGIVISDLANPVFAEFVHGAEQEARNRDVGLLLCDSHGSVEMQREHLRRLAQRRVDGIILHQLGSYPYEDDVARLRTAGIAAVVAGQRVASNAVPEVVVDEHAASVEAFVHLLKQGHRRVALVLREYPGAPEDARNTVGDRVGAYREAHELVGCAVEPAMMLRARTPAEVEPAVRARLSGPGGPTAIVAGSQLFALEVLSAAASVGACIPKDLSFITYGDARWAQVWNPPIGVVRTDYKEYGRRCAALLFAVSGGEEIEPTVHHPAEFVARASTAPVIA